jgi:aminoglycoside 6'-N-acetyltransferase
MEETSAEETLIDFKCPHCGFMASFPESQVGTLQECPECVELIIVPSAGAPVGKPLPVPINTARLQLRRLVGADLTDLLEIERDAQSFRYIDWTPIGESEMEDWLKSQKTVRLLESGGSLCLGIDLVAESKLIGLLSVSYITEDRQQLDFTLMINPNYRRRGFGAEAVRGLIGFVLSGINAHRINAWCDSRNTAARRLLEKAGLRREGESLKNHFQKGEWIDTTWYALLREEYK